ncbi:MAG: Rossmann-like domain-containing protein, partial [Anaerolineales bacterium]
LSVLSSNPRPGDLPASAAPQVIPSADLVAITGMTLINHTLESLLELCSRQALVMILGPSTPLSPVLFDHGVDLLSGSLVTDRNAVMQVAGQGGNFRQIHRAGVRLVTVERPGWREGKIPS